MIFKNANFALSELVPFVLTSSSLTTLREELISNKSSESFDFNWYKNLILDQLVTCFHSCAGFFSNKGWGMRAFTLDLERIIIFSQWSCWHSLTVHFRKWKLDGCRKETDLLKISEGGHVVCKLRPVYVGGQTSGVLLRTVVVTTQVIWNFLKR